MRHLWPVLTFLLVLACSNPTPDPFPPPDPTPTPTPTPDPAPVVDWAKVLDLVERANSGGSVTVAESVALMGTPWQDYTQPLPPQHNVKSWRVKGPDGPRNVHVHFLNSLAVEARIR